MGLNLNAPQVSAVPIPAPRLTSYRYWQHYARKYWRAIRDTVARVIDGQERRRDLFEEAPTAAPSLVAAVPETAAVPRRPRRTKPSVICSRPRRPTNSLTARRAGGSSTVPASPTPKADRWCAARWSTSASNTGSSSR